MVYLWNISDTLWWWLRWQWQWWRFYLNPHYIHIGLFMSIYSTFIDFLACSMSILLMNMDTEWIIQHRTVSSSMTQLPKLCLTLINCCANYDFGDPWPWPIRSCPGWYSLWSQVRYSPHWTRYGIRMCSKPNVTSSLMTSAQNALLKWFVTIFDISLK